MGPVVQLFSEGLVAVVATSAFVVAAMVYLAASARLDQTEHAMRELRVDGAPLVRKNSSLASADRQFCFRRLSSASQSSGRRQSWRPSL